MHSATVTIATSQHGQDRAKLRQSQSACSDMQHVCHTYALGCTWLHSCSLFDRGNRGCRGVSPLLPLKLHRSFPVVSHLQGRVEVAIPALTETWVEAVPSGSIGARATLLFCFFAFECTMDANVMHSRESTCSLQICCCACAMTFMGLPVVITPVASCGHPCCSNILTSLDFDSPDIAQQTVTIGALPSGQGPGECMYHCAKCPAAAHLDDSKGCLHELLCFIREHCLQPLRPAPNSVIHMHSTHRLIPGIRIFLVSFCGPVYMARPLL